jgi:hypothetical protein
LPVYLREVVQQLGRRPLRWTGLLVLYSRRCVYKPGTEFVPLFFQLLKKGLKLRIHGGGGF